MNALFEKIDCPCGESQYVMNDEHLDETIASLVFNNTFCPNVERVVFNTKTTDEVARLDESGAPLKDEKGRVVKETVKLDSPVLATVVYFADGTKSTVKNSHGDKITLVKEKVALSDGSTVEVETASEQSKENGLMAAILKRMVTGLDEDGNSTGRKFSKFLKAAVSDAFVQDVEAVKSRNERSIAKAKAKAKANEPKAPKDEKPRRKSLGEVVAELAAAVRELKAK